jgi:hypothetical protein
VAEEPGQPGEQGPETPPESEEELRARIEEGLRKVRVQDVLLESVVTIVNLTARRIAKEDERDLEQARVGVESIKAVIDLLEPEAQTQVRNALSELQVLYARAVEGKPMGADDEPSEEPSAQAQPEAPQQGPKEPPPGLWVPPGSS